MPYAEKCLLAQTLGITQTVFARPSMINTSAPAHTTTPNADFFRAMEVERTRAIVARDLQAIARLHAIDYELITPPGRIMTQERYFSLIAA